MLKTSLSFKYVEIMNLEQICVDFLRKWRSKQTNPQHLMYALNYPLPLLCS